MLESQAIPGLKKKLTLAPMGLDPGLREAPDGGAQSAGLSYRLDWMWLRSTG